MNGRERATHRIDEQPRANWAVVLRFWLPVLVWAALIYTVSAIPSLNTGWGAWDLLLRKTAHMVEFGVLNVLLMRALHGSWPRLAATRVVLLGSFLSLLYAASDEFHQGFVPGRTGSALDVVVDGVGIVLAGLFYGRVLAVRWKKVVNAVKSPKVSKI